MKFVVYKMSEAFENRREVKVIEINTLEELVEFYRGTEAAIGDIFNGLILTENFLCSAHKYSVRNDGPEFAICIYDDYVE